MRRRANGFPGAGFLCFIMVLGVFAVPTAALAGKIVVANRASGTISVIDTKTDQVTHTVALPMDPGDAAPEPMYVVNTRAKNRVFVGDRANDRVVVFDGRHFNVVGTVPAGAGVFHMWADRAGHQLWVVNDVDDTVTVIDPRRLEVIATVPMPADLTAAGAKPHDVILRDTGKRAYVSFLGVPGDTDFVVAFDTRTFEEIARAEVGNDPHLGYAQHLKRLYVASQGGDAVWVLDAETLAEIAVVPVPNAHGSAMATNERRFYTTNIADGGIGGAVAFDPVGNAVFGATDTGPAGAPLPVPHNVALTPNARKLYVTHSGGGSTAVTVYAVSNRHPVPVFRKTVAVGANPFGLGYVR